MSEMVLQKMKELAYRVSPSMNKQSELNTRVDDDLVWDDAEEHPGLVPMKKMQGLPKRDLYGTFGNIPIAGAPAVVSAYNSFQSLLTVVAALWFLYSVGQHLFGGEASSAPSPAPLGTAPACKAYTYPECENALHWYIAQGARSRCDAFERVKAEGDFIRTPYLPSALQDEICSKEGCCGCAGQCSKCPPLLAECMSWMLDGSWDVAFVNGQAAKYHFDAKGHCEVDMSAGAVPPGYTHTEAAYIPQGNDILGSPTWLTVKGAKKSCSKHPECVGFTYDGTSKTEEDKYMVWLKSASAYQKAQDTQWHTYVVDRHPVLDGKVAVAGPLIQVNTSDSSIAQATGPVFRFDLHGAAPTLFPKNATDIFTVTSTGELQVQRWLLGQKVLNGTGIELRSSE